VSAVLRNSSLTSLTLLVTCRTTDLRSLKKLYGVPFFNLLNLFLKVLSVVALMTWLRSQFQRRLVAEEVPSHFQMTALCG